MPTRTGLLDSNIAVALPQRLRRRSTQNRKIQNLDETRFSLLLSGKRLMLQEDLGVAGTEKHETNFIEVTIVSQEFLHSS